MLSIAEHHFKTIQTVLCDTWHVEYAFYLSAPALPLVMEGVAVTALTCVPLIAVYFDRTITSKEELLAEKQHRAPQNRDFQLCEWANPSQWSKFAGILISNNVAENLGLALHGQRSHSVRLPITIK